MKPISASRFAIALLRPAAGAWLFIAVLLGACTTASLPAGCPPECFKADLRDKTPTRPGAASPRSTRRRAWSRQ